MNKAELMRRSERMTMEAQAAVSKRGIMQFRAAQEDISALYNLALKRDQRVSTMVREWVLERLEQERGNAPVKFDITVNKEKVGSVSFGPGVLNAINEDAKVQRHKVRRTKAG